MKSKVILGIDEVGRGPWAGPLVVGAVILGDEQAEKWSALTDSKKLSAKKRAEFSQLIKAESVYAELGWVKSTEVDQYGLSYSLKLATERATQPLLTQKCAFDEIVIDGTVNFLQNTPFSDRVTLLKKADSLVKSVSAASIIAKVARDSYMQSLDAKYPEYHFGSHVGYGTAKHRAALLEHGVCPEHRRSFRPIQAILQNHPSHSVVDAKLSFSESATSYSRIDSDSSDNKACCQIYNNMQKSSCKNYNKALNNRLKEADNTCCKKYNKSQNSCCKNHNIDSHSQVGYQAETIVANFLEREAHTILARNYRTRFYEIDIISQYDDRLYFTEVKYSQNAQVMNTPFARIDADKQRRMHLAAMDFIQNHPEFHAFQPLLAVASVQGVNFDLENWFVLDT